MRRRILALVAAVAPVLSYSAPSLAWDTPEHEDICKKIDVPLVLGGVKVGGYTIEQWCALPDYGSSMNQIVTSGMCSGALGFTKHHDWDEYLVGGVCALELMENINHFGGFAYSTWHYYHQIAKQAAQKYAQSCTPGCDAAAFAIEGWGLHYLTDVFAAGHAWNPLGDYETPEGSYWMTHSSSDILPDAIFPPPGGINIYRQTIHDHLNSASIMAPPPATRFADPFWGPVDDGSFGVLGDYQWSPTLIVPPEQVAWTLDRGRAAVLDIYWTLLGVQGMGGCQLSDICTPDYLKGYLEQGNAWQCVPFVSNQSFKQAFLAKNANAECDTYYGYCDTSNPKGHECAWEDPGRAIPFWPGSLHYYIDNANVIGQLGCNMGDPTVYDGGNCGNTKYNKDDVIADVCTQVPVGGCSFVNGCDVPTPGVGPGEGGAGGGGNGGSGAMSAGGGAAEGGNGSGAANAGGDDAGGSGGDGTGANNTGGPNAGCSGGCAVSDTQSPSWMGLAAASLLTLLSRRRKRAA